MPSSHPINAPECFGQNLYYCMEDSRQHFKQLLLFAKLHNGIYLDMSCKLQLINGLILQQIIKKKNLRYEDLFVLVLTLCIF